MAALAARQHGVVARRQLLEFGVGRGSIEKWLGAGRLHPVHRGVYAVGHRKLSYQGRWMAGVLACGPDAVLSHMTAASAWDLLQSSSGRIHVTAPRSRGRVPKLTLYRSRQLPSQDRAELEGIPVTSLYRTLVDLAAVAPRAQVERALEQAIRMQIFDLHALNELLDRSRGRKGPRTLRQLVADHHPDAVGTRQELERRFFEFCRRRGLPLPATNVVVAGIEVDAYWPAHRLVVELDSWKHHGSRRTFEGDHSKTAVLQLAGYAVVRVTWRMLHDDPGTVAALLQARFERPVAEPVRG